MKAMIFAAGYGSRLKPWTDSHPKALVEVGQHPMLGRVIDKIEAAGISDIIINTHHFAEQIDHFIKKNYPGHDITISHEPKLLDTGGGLRKALKYIGDEPVLIHNADIFTDFDLEAMIDFHNQRQADATLLTDIRSTSRFLTFDRETEFMNGWTSSPTRCLPEQLDLPADRFARAFGGVHILSPSLYGDIYDFAPDEESFSIMDFYKKMCAKHKFAPYLRPEDSCWFDIGKPETLEAARSYIQNL